MFSNKQVSAGLRLLLSIGVLLATANAATAWDDQYIDRMDKITAGAGNAVAHNKAVQTVDPWPRYVGNNRIRIDGSRIALGFKRYQENKSIPPDGLRTSGFSLSSGGGN